MDSIRNRRTIRKYKQQDIPAELLNGLLEEAFRASTMGNMQLYSVVVTRNAERKALLAPAHFNQPMVTSAPVVLTFCADFNRFSKWCRQRKAEPGYDNQHPDYTPACQAAGGWEGMKSLVDTMHDFGYKFGIHDQYRDYYHAAPSYDENYACRLPDGTIPGHSYWAGGPQSYLCATQAPFYVKRNFAELKKNGIRLDGAYLDVFTCNEGDECANPEHVMTRRDCYTYRGNCFSWLLSQGILSSSEEVSDWAVPYLVFCHYAPYDFMLRPSETPKKGIPVPLFNLVYHDCVIEPWMMDRVSKDEDYMLYALLAGGAPYLVRDGAYPNTDGAFDGEKISLEEMTERCRVVTELHEKTALLELVRHECMTADGSVQKSEFSDGTYVICDFAEQIYEIGYGA